MQNNIYCWKIEDYSLDSVARVMESKGSQIFLLSAGISHSYRIMNLEPFYFLFLLKNIKLCNFIGVDFLLALTFHMWRAYRSNFPQLKKKIVRFYIPHRSSSANYWSYWSVHKLWWWHKIFFVVLDCKARYIILILTGVIYMEPRGSLKSNKNNKQETEGKVSGVVCQW